MTTLKDTSTLASCHNTSKSRSIIRKKDLRSDYTRDLQKEPTKETYKRDLQKRQTTVKDAPTLASCHNTNESRSIIREKRLTIWLYKRPTKGTCTRDLQKRPAKVTYKSDLQKWHTKETDLCPRKPTHPHSHHVTIPTSHVVLFAKKTHNFSLYKRPTEETYKTDLQKRPAKETLTRDLQKRQICAHPSKHAHTRIMSNYQRVTFYYLQKRLAAWLYKRSKKRK